MLLAAALLLVLGVGIYLPVGGITGRYTIPAIWGLDLGLAVLLTAVWSAPATAWKRAGLASLAVGLAVVLAANFGKQSTIKARSELLWQTLAFLEAHNTAAERTAWLGLQFPTHGELAAGEAVHFRAYLKRRGRNRIPLAYVDLAARTAVPPDCAYAVQGGDEPPASGQWQRAGTFTTTYWLGWRQYRCTLWRALTSQAERASCTR